LTVGGSSGDPSSFSPIACSTTRRAVIAKSLDFLLERLGTNQIWHDEDSGGKLCDFTLTHYRFTGGMLYYSGQVGSLHEQLHGKDQQINDRDQRISRYRVELGVDPASKGALVELKHSELSLKTTNLVFKLWVMANNFDDEMKGIEGRQKDGSLNHQQYENAKLEIMNKYAREFDQNLASEALLVEGELLRRLDPQVVANIPRPFAPVTADHMPINDLQLFRGSASQAFDLFRLKQFADELDQMAKLLPSD
jgi:hypothetical protein